MSEATELIAQQLGSAISNQRTWGSIIYNPKDPQFGATGLGVANDGPALQSVVSAIGSNKGNITFPPGSYKVSTNVNLGANTALEFMKGSSLIRDPGITVSPTALINAGVEFGRSFRNTGLSGFDIYNPIYGSVSNFDMVQGIVETAAGSNIIQSNGVSAYIKNSSTGTNAVGLFGCGYTDVNSGRIWGINTLLQDSAVRVAGTALGRFLQNEFDFNVMNPDTQVLGASVGGNSLAQPKLAYGFVSNSLGSGIKWNVGFMSMDDCATFALVAGRSATGVTKDSQSIGFNCTDVNGNIVQNQLKTMNNGWWQFSSPAADGSLKVVGGSVLLDVGKGYFVNGNKIVGDRQAAIANATNATDVITQLNALLAACRTHGLIA